MTVIIRFRDIYKTIILYLGKLFYIIDVVDLQIEENKKLIKSNTFNF